MTPSASPHLQERHLQGPHLQGLGLQGPHLQAPLHPQFQLHREAGIPSQ